MDRWLLPSMNRQGWKGYGWIEIEEWKDDSIIIDLWIPPISIFVLVSISTYNVDDYLL